MRVHNLPQSDRMAEAEAVQNEPAPEPEVTGCGADLDTFHQFTGQCWSDAAIVFLLFSNTLGPVVQTRLQEEGEGIRDSFEAWAGPNKAIIDAIAGFELSEETLKSFVDKTKQYLFCIHRRFENSTLRQVRLNVGIQKQPQLRRCDSMIFSYCQEATAILATELLHRVKIGATNRNNIEDVVREREANLERSIQKYIGQGLIEKPVDESAPGYNNLRVGKFIAVLIKFFKPDTGHLELSTVEPSALGERLTADMALYRDIDVILKQSDELIKKMGEEITDEEIEATEISDEDLAKAMKEIEDAENAEGGGAAPVVADPFDKDVFNYEYVTNIPDTVHFSMVLGLQSLTGGKHAVCFLTCADGEQYIYDDNIGVLLKIPWRKAINKNFTRFYIAYESTDGSPVSKYALLGTNPETLDSISVSKRGVKYTKGKKILTSSQFMTALEMHFPKPKGVVYSLYEFSYIFAQAPMKAPDAGGGGGGAGAAAAQSGGRTRRRPKQERRLRSRPTRRQ